MKQKLLFFDVDGTLSYGHQPISSLVKEALIQARKNGHKIFLCTGRNKKGIERELQEITFDGYVASAGSYVVINDDVIVNENFSDKLRKKAVDAFQQCNMAYNFECTSQTFMTEEMLEHFARSDHQDANNSELARLKAEVNEKFNTKKMEEYLGEGVHKMSFVALDIKDMQDCQKIIGDDFNFVVHEIFSKETINGEIISKQFNKATGIQAVIDYLGATKEDTIGFGDSMNDYEMIDFVGYGEVMANGSEDLKKIANHVCLSVQEDGIYHELKRLQII